MTPIDRAVIAWECERMIHHYAMLNDAGDFHAMAEMFAADGGYSRPTAPDVFIRGKEAVLASYLARPPRYTRHMITSVVVTVQDADNASAHSYLALHTGKPGEDGAVGQADPAYLIGDFRDTFVREGGGWKFKDRRGSLAMRVGGA
jgi:3-phenylpropionate/cinnamic acid dioxygenase small subunit